jgi:hypothetical protein
MLHQHQLSNNTVVQVYLPAKGSSGDGGRLAGAPLIEGRVALDEGSEGSR